MIKYSNQSSGSLSCVGSNSVLNFTEGRGEREKERKQQRIGVREDENIQFGLQPPFCLSPPRSRSPPSHHSGLLGARAARSFN
jgi:hypothetical protein